MPVMFVVQAEDGIRDVAVTGVQTCALPICQSLILSCFLPLPENSKRRKIVYSELNFPSVMYVYDAHARDHGLRIDIVKSDDGITAPPERMLAARDEDTLPVPESALLFQKAILQFREIILEPAHEV